MLSLCTVPDFCICPEISEYILEFLADKIAGGGGGVIGIGIYRLAKLTLSTRACRDSAREAIFTRVLVYLQSFIIGMRTVLSPVVPYMTGGRFLFFYACV